MSCLITSRSQHAERVTRCQDIGKDLRQSIWRQAICRPRRCMPADAPGCKHGMVCAKRHLTLSTRPKTPTHLRRVAGQLADPGRLLPAPRRLPQAQRAPHQRQAVTPTHLRVCQRALGHLFAMHASLTHCSSAHRQGGHSKQQTVITGGRRSLAAVMGQVWSHLERLLRAAEVLHID